ncbi:MAG: hypothetical protein ACPGQF_11060, partial [Akkermansiaceae bacterium]
MERKPTLLGSGKRLPFMTDVAISKAHEPESRITETAPIPGGLAIATIVSDIRISLKEPYPTLQG